jgi:hypothetical protein
LLIRRGEVGRDVLIDGLCGEQPPAGARTESEYICALAEGGLLTLDDTIAYALGESQ